MFEAVINPYTSNRWFDVYTVQERGIVKLNLKEIPDAELEQRRSEGKLTSLAKGETLLGSSREALAGTVTLMGYLGARYIRQNHWGRDLLAAWTNPMVMDDARGAAAALRTGRKCVVFHEAMNGLHALGFRHVEACDQGKRHGRYGMCDRKTPVLWHAGKLWGVKRFPLHYELGAKLTKKVEERVRRDNGVRKMDGLRPEYPFEAFPGRELRVSSVFRDFYNHPALAYFYGDEKAHGEFKASRKEAVRAAAAAIGVPRDMLAIRFGSDPADEKARFDPEVALAGRRLWPVPCRSIYEADTAFGTRPGELPTRRLMSDAGYCRYMATKGRPDFLIDYRAWRRLRNERLREWEEVNDD